MNIGILFLLTSSVCDAVWNICLKQSRGATDWLVNIIGGSFLMIGIVVFTKALVYFPLSIATVIWFGASLVLTVLADVLIFKTVLNFKLALFMMLCLSSIAGLIYVASSK